MSSQVPAIKRPSDNYRHVALIGYGVIFLTFGVVGGWAALAPLGSAVIGPAVVAVENNRKTVQAPPEGGIVRQIQVHEGDKVKANQVLFALDSTSTHANYEIAQNELFTYLAQEARLTAERDDRSTITFPQELLSAQNDPTAQRAMTDELKQFAERRGTQAGQVGILNSRIDQSRTEIKGIQDQQTSMQQEVDLLTDEINGLQTLYDKGLVPKPRLLAVQRERSSMEGQIGRLIADRSKTDKEIGETTLQIRQIKQTFDQDVSKELGEVSAKISEVRQRYAVAQDQASRINVTAPVSGSAQSLRVFTVGAVIRPGDPLVDIVPDSEEMIVQAHFSPNDIENVHEGQAVEVRFPSFHDRTLPGISGTIRSVSTDRLVDEQTHAPYYLAIVVVRPDQLPKALRGRLLAGMPSQVTVPTGQRTVLQYMTDPLMRTLQTSMREK